MHTVDEQQRAGVMDQIGDRDQVGPGAEQVRRAGQRDETGPGSELVRDVGRGELGGVGVEVDEPHACAGPLGRDDPRTDVRVVIEAAHHHLVARPPSGRQRAGQFEGQRGHAAAEHDALGPGAEQVGHRGPGGVDGVLGPLLGGGDAAPVGDRGHQRGVDGVGHHVRRLRPAGPVEVRRARGEGGEVSTDRGDVESHEPHSSTTGQDAPPPVENLPRPAGIARASPEGHPTCLHRLAPER